MTTTKKLVWILGEKYNDFYSYFSVVLVSSDDVRSFNVATQAYQYGVQVAYVGRNSHTQSLDQW